VWSATSRGRRRPGAHAPGYALPPPFGGSDTDPCCAQHIHRELARYGMRWLSLLESYRTLEPAAPELAAKKSARIIWPTVSPFAPRKSGLSRSERRQLYSAGA
jgi:hypothetical protein